jgi:hypothetical protein
LALQAVSLFLPNELTVNFNGRLPLQTYILMVKEANQLKIYLFLLKT